MIYTLHNGKELFLDEKDEFMIFSEYSNRMINKYFEVDMLNCHPKDTNEYNFIVRNIKAIVDEYENIYWDNGPIPYDREAFDETLDRVKRKKGYKIAKE